MTDENRESQFASNFRFYVELRFKQLALFLSAMTAAGVGVAQFPMERWWVAVAALMVTVAPNLRAGSRAHARPALEVRPLRGRRTWMTIRSGFGL
jgi:hypothetical protein